MDWRGLRATLRFDGAAWRRFAELGCVYGPEWWKRGSPPVIAAVIFAIGRAQRAAVLANQRQVRAPIRGPRGWLRERWHAYRVFAEFARSVTEAMEQWGPRPRPLALDVLGAEIFEAALAEHRGLVALTGHFGSWEAAPRRPALPARGGGGLRAADAGRERGGARRHRRRLRAAGARGAGAVAHVRGRVGRAGGGRARRGRDGAPGGGVAAGVAAARAEYSGRRGGVCPSRRGAGSEGSAVALYEIVPQASGFRLR